MQVQAFVRAATALTALAAIMAAPAHAAVVTYNGPALPIAQSIDGLYLNVVTGSTVTGGSGWDINVYYNDARIGFWSPGGNNGYVGSGITIDALSMGSVVGPGSSFVNTNVTGGFSNPVFEAPGTNFFGFRFVNEAGGTVHYGWAEISTGADAGFPAAILRYAYDNTPNTAITVVPEPSTYALMLAGVVGLAGFAARRRKAA